MGSYEGAETCELVGCYLLSQLTQIPEIHWHRPVPWWRPGGSKSDPQKIENAKKEICRIFTNNNLWITIQANKFIWYNARPDHWEIQAIFKTRDHQLYVYSKSSDPNNIIRNIPEAIKKRLSEISSDNDAFSKEAAPYTRKHYARAGMHTNSEITVWRVADETSRVTRHDRVSEGCWAGESRCSQVTWKKKHHTLTATNIPEEVISKRSNFCLAFLLNDQPLQVMMTK